MFKSKAKSLADLIGASSGDLHNLAEAAQLRTDLSDYLRDSLDKSLRGGFVHCNLRDDTTLVIVASNSAWASRLRFEERMFVELCRERGIAIKTVRVRVSGDQV